MLAIEATSDTPRVVFNDDTGEFTISGRSFPMDVHEFYAPFLRHLKNYLLNPKPQTRFEIALEYYNSTSMKIILSMIAQFKELHPEKSNVEVVWIYIEDDEDMRDVGAVIAQQINFPVQVISRSAD